MKKLWLPQEVLYDILIPSNSKPYKNRRSNIMKSIRRSLGLFAAAFALCLIVALGVKAEAAESKMQERLVDNGSMAVPMVTDITRDGFVAGTSSYSVSNSNTLHVEGIAPADADYVEVGVFDYKGQFVASDEAYCYSSGLFSSYVYGLAKNKVYYVQVRTIQEVDGQKVYGNWSERRAVVFLKNKAKERENYSAGYETLTLKTKKIKGIKKYKVQVSKKRDTGYKNVKTIKAGKSITVSHYKGKRMKVGKTWYIRVIPILNSKIPSDTWSIYYI